jgi:nucleoside-diphosphate-sugar epimerase
MAMAQRICVTGASGQAGRAVVRELIEHGYDVAATDIAATRADIEGGMLRADLTDYGQTVEALHDTEAVVHLANIPAPDVYTPATTFNTNITMNFNVFHAAANLGLGRVVWASSETTLGLPFDIPPRYAPVDEDHYPVPTTAYALSKVASETIAGHIAQWSGIPFVALRFSNIMAPGDYEHFPVEAWPDPIERKWNLWGYVDERDVAAACRLALQAPREAVAGSPAFIIAAADTAMNRPSADLLAEVFPQVELTREVAEFGTLLAIDRARAVLGYEPRHSWRDHLPDQAAATRA